MGWRRLHPLYRSLGGVVALGILPSPLWADPVGAQPVQSREAGLEKRLAELEQAVAALRAELAAARQALPAAIDNEPRTAMMSGSPTSRPGRESAPATPPGDGFMAGGTRVRLNGYIKAVASASRYDDGTVPPGSLGKDFYLPQTIPVGGSGRGHDFAAQAKQTRLWLTTETPAGGDMIRAHLEFDFQTAPGTQGSQRTTNGYNLALRRGFVRYGRWLVGQEWSNFQYVAALPETTDFVGTTEGTVFERQMQLRYTIALSPRLALSLSAENAETSSETPASPLMVENDSDRLPDATARLLLSMDGGEVSLAALVRQLSIESGSVSDHAIGWGVSGAGKIAFGPARRHDLRFMLSYGRGIGRYLGLNFVPDVIFNPAGDAELHLVHNLAGFVAVRVGWTDKLRSTLMASYQKTDYPSGTAVPPGSNARAQSVAANLFWTPMPGLDLGAEIRHGERRIVSGASGQMDRLELSAKYGF
ncbi:MAG: DcaP family trimeric outer membrane transporter [Pseudomonadota bacterium]